MIDWMRFTRKMRYAMGLSVVGFLAVFAIFALTVDGKAGSGPKVTEKVSNRGKCEWWMVKFFTAMDTCASAPGGVDHKLTRECITLSGLPCCKSTQLARETPLHIIHTPIGVVGWPPLCEQCRVPGSDKPHKGCVDRWTDTGRVEPVKAGPYKFLQRILSCLVLSGTWYVPWGTSQNGHTPKRPQPERPDWVGSLPERPHYFGQNGHTALVKTAT